MRYNWPTVNCTYFTVKFGKFWHVYVCEIIMSNWWTYSSPPKVSLCLCNPDLQAMLTPLCPQQLPIHFSTDWPAFSRNLYKWNWTICNLLAGFFCSAYLFRDLFILSHVSIVLFYLWVVFPCMYGYNLFIHSWSCWRTCRLSPVWNYDRQNCSEHLCIISL